MTNKEFYNAIINANISDEMTEKAKALLVSVEKKSESKSKASAENRTKNMALVKQLIAMLEKGETYAVSEIKQITESKLSNSKLTAIFKVAVEENLCEMVNDYKVGGKGRAVKGYRIK